MLKKYANKATVGRMAVNHLQGIDPSTTPVAMHTAKVK